MLASPSKLGQGSNLTKLLTRRQAAIAMAGLPFGPVSTYTQAQADPISVYKIATWLAEGAVAYIGGQAIRSILGSGSKYDLSDVQAWVEDAIKSIQAFVSEELHRQFDQEAIKLIADQLSQSRLNMLDYDAAKDLDLMRRSVDTLNLVLPRSERYGLQTVWVYADALSMKLICYSALIRDHNRREYKIRVEPSIDDGIEHIERVILEHMKYLEEGIASVTPVTVTYENRNSKYRDAKYFARFQYRGNSYQWGDYSTEAALAKANEEHKKVVAQFKDNMADAQNYLHPQLRAVEDSWVKTREKLIGGR